MIYVVIPTYNERETIEKLISRILALRLNLKIVVVDDNSPDGTGKLVARLSHQLPVFLINLVTSPSFWKVAKRSIW